MQEQWSVSYGTRTSIESESRQQLDNSYFRQDFTEGVRDFESVGDPSDGDEPLLITTRNGG